MSESTKSSLDQIIATIDQLAKLAHAAAILEGQDLQRGMLEHLKQQYAVLGTLLGNLAVSSGDQISVGGISGSTGIAIGRGAQSTVHTVDTAGGDYAEGQIDKREGVFVSGGEVKGPVVGTNSGTIETKYGSE